MTACDCKQCRLGWRGPTACTAADITYRQLDYWARTDLVEPSIRSANGSGSQRLYCFHDILFLRLVRRLLDCGVSVQSAREVVAAIRASGVEDLTRLTLLSSGVGVAVLTDVQELEALLAGSSVCVAISLKPLCGEVSAALDDGSAESAYFGAVF